MPIIKIIPDYSVNTDNILDVTVMDRTDSYPEPHVVINYKTYGRPIPPEYTYQEIMAALDGKCYYREEWDDMCGHIAVCVIHGQNSQFDPSSGGPFRPCLEIKPWREHRDYSIFGVAVAPDRSQAWEVREKERKDYIEEPPIKLTPVAEYLASGEGMTESDHSATGLTYTFDEPHRPWWKRLFGLY